MQHDNAVGADDRRQAMSNDQHCALPCVTVYCLLHQFFGFAIDGRGRLVEEQIGASRNRARARAMR